MLHGSHHPGVAGSELTRLLARLAGTSPTRTGLVFAERLGHWLSWSDAISLSTALNAITPATSSGRSRRSDDVEADFQRVRATLAASIATGSREAASSPTDFGPHRRHCLAQQQAMHDAVGALRQRLRDALAQRSPALARLAAIDVAMDSTIAVRERGLLALVPLRLQSHFERLQHNAGGDVDWTPTFRDDMTLVLQAELDHRLLPARGLLDTLLLHRTTA